jgi:hypothetical protein
MKAHRLLALSALALGLAGCGSDTTLPADCPDILQVVVEPAKRTLRVGETVQARAFRVSCDGERTPYTVAWRTTSPGIVGVEGTTGVITGLAAGTATVTAHEPTVSMDWSWGSVAVQVIPG